MAFRKIGLFVILIFISLNKIVAQNPLLRHYTPNDGLPSSTIYPMIQDKDGFIWFGTDAGVTRFDGKRFKNFTIADGLSDNTILNVKTDSKWKNSPYLTPFIRSILTPCFFFKKVDQNPIDLYSKKG